MSQAAADGLAWRASAELPTRFGSFTMHGFDNAAGTMPYIALVKGDITRGGPVLTRVHSSCLTGDAFGSRRCDCGEQFRAAQKKIAEAGRGVLVYAPQEGRGIGIINKIRAYALQDGGMDTMDANLHLGLPPDARNYAAAASVLRDLGVTRVGLITNNREKIEALREHGIEVAGRIILPVQPNTDSLFYLETKRVRMGHAYGALTT